MPATVGWVTPRSLDSDGSKSVPVDASLSAESAFTLGTVDSVLAALFSCSTQSAESACTLGTVDS